MQRIYLLIFIFAKDKIAYLAWHVSSIQRPSRFFPLKKIQREVDWLRVVSGRRTNRGGGGLLWGSARGAFDTTGAARGEGCEACCRSVKWWSRKRGTKKLFFVKGKVDQNFDPQPNGGVTLNFREIRRNVIKHLKKARKTNTSWDELILLKSDQAWKATVLVKSRKPALFEAGLINWDMRFSRGWIEIMKGQEACLRWTYQT